jgi:vancomycin aglycone glucosyltransferase
MLALGEHLQNAGHDVYLCGPPDAEPECRERGIELRPMGLAVREFMTSHAADIARGRLGMARAGQRYFEATVARQFERLPDATRDADVVLGAGLCFAGPSAAELHGVPYRFVTYCPVLFPSSEHSPFVAPSARAPRWLNRLLWALAVPALELLVGRRINRERERLGLPRQSRSYRELLSPRPILSADPVLAPVPADCEIPVTRIPELRPSNATALPEKLAAFLDAGAPPVYVGFGSMPDPDPDATTERILAAVTATGCRAVISSGWAGLGGRPLPTNVFRAGEVDHSRLFPRTAAVVHHGGAGTTAAAARAGVPQVVVPHGVDQHYWAGRVQALGTAPPAIPRNRLTAPALADALVAILDNEFVSERAAELAARMRASTGQELDPTSLLDLGGRSEGP